VTVVIFYANEQKPMTVTIADLKWLILEISCQISIQVVSIDLFTREEGGTF